MSTLSQSSIVLGAKKNGQPKGPVKMVRFKS